VTPQDQLNRALGKTMDVSESSTNPAYGNPQNMVDGDTTTRWESPPRNSEWVECYLGNIYQITRVVIVWGPGYAASYRLRLSTDNGTWTTAKSVTAGGGGTETLDSINSPAGFITLILDTRPADSAGFSIREFRVFGTLNTNSASGGTPGLPAAYDMAQNYPNPFNPSTTIAFALPAESNVTLTIHNTLGQNVATLARGKMAAGYHTVAWHAAVASGVYICRLSASAVAAPGTRFQKTIKLLLIR
ncbi:MAG TPA: discoidin domain-containing protein, partial [Bacteroidota bacterium]|nr:discoidin domain-containing protein [Bacteroidota bacterium]